MKKITLKEDWIAVVSTLPKNMRNEIIGAVTLYLATGEYPEVSKKSTPFLNIVMAMVNKFEEKSEKMRSNRLKRGICNNKCDTIVDTNGQQMCNKCVTNVQEKEEVPSLPLKLSNITEEEKENNLKEKTPKGVKEKAPKRKFADNVHLSQIEYDKLVEKFGNEGTMWMIDKLNAYKTEKGKSYKSDYGAILNWVVERYRDYETKQRQNSKPSAIDIYFDAASKLANGELL